MKKIIFLCFIGILALWAGCSEEIDESIPEVDQIPPTISSFSVVTKDFSQPKIDFSFSATDDLMLTAYYVSDNSKTPALSAEGWVTMSESSSFSDTISYTFQSAGEKTTYVWTRDRIGNVSESSSVNLTLVDNKTPVNPKISMSGDGSVSYLVPTLQLSAKDEVWGIAAYYLSEKDSTPDLNASGWKKVDTSTSFSSSIPYEFGSGNKTIFAWFKDGSGNISDVVSVSVSVSVSDPMVKISKGTFTMGDIQGGGDSDESPSHSVTLSKNFYISDHEVTAAEYKACVDDGECSAAGSGTYATYNTSGKENNPINYVSWDDAQSYITWLNQDSSRTFRLCTEAEWEYAARAGTDTKWSCGNEESCLGSVAWYSSNSGSTTQEVKTKNANAWGLYDMHGNVYEWVQDWYGDYSAGAVTDPVGPSSGSYRVLRGGYFDYAATGLRSAVRHWNSPGIRRSFIGFRLCSSS